MTRWADGCILTLGLRMVDAKGRVLARGSVELWRARGTFTFSNPREINLPVIRKGEPAAYHYYEPDILGHPTIFKCRTKPDISLVLPDDTLHFDRGKLVLDVARKRG